MTHNSPWLKPSVIRGVRIRIRIVLVLICLGILYMNYPYIELFLNNLFK